MEKAGILASAPRELTLIAGLSSHQDFNGVSENSIRYILRRGGTRVAMMSAEGFYSGQYYLPHVEMENGLIRDISYRPANDFFHIKDGNNRDVLVFNGVEPNRNSKEYAEVFADVTNHFGVKTVYVLGAIPDQLPHTRPPLFYGYFSDPKFYGLLKEQGFHFQTHRGSSNIYPSLVSEAQKRGIDAVGVDIRLPVYFRSLDDPRGTRALLERICKLSGLEFDLKPLDEQIHRIEEQISHAMSNPQFRVLVGALETMYDSPDTQSRIEFTPLTPELESFLRELEDPGNS